MVRIIQDDIQQTLQKLKPQPESEQLGYRHHVLLNVIGFVVADAPEKVRQLLGEYSIELSGESTGEELADTLLLAIGERDEDFNRDLASLILDSTLSSSYDHYDFKQLAGQTATILSNVGNNQNGEGQNPPSVIGGLASTIGQIGGILSQTIQSQSSASEHTRQGILAYRKQLAAQQEADENKKNNILLFLLLFAMGIGILGLMAYKKRQAQPIIKTS